MSEQLPIENGHDYFTVEVVEDEYDDHAGSVHVLMWSRGTFSVDVWLDPRDAMTFSQTLADASIAANLALSIDTKTLTHGQR